MTVDIEVTPSDITAITGLDEPTMQGMCANKLDRVCEELGHELEFFFEMLINTGQYDIDGMFSYIAGKAFDGRL